MHCTLCHSPLTEQLDEEYFECKECHGIVKDKRLYPDRIAEKAFYLTHENDVHNPRYRKFTAPASGYILAHFTKKHRGLDYGSGTGPVISRVLQEQQYQIQQYDPYFANSPAVLDTTYDYIVACEVIEHFYHPQWEFNRLRKLLKPGGQLIGMTLLYQPGMDFANWRYRKDPTHVFLYQEGTVHYIQRLFDFTSVKIWDGRLIVWQTQ